MSTTIVLPNVGLWVKMGVLANQMAADLANVKLFRNNHTVTDTTTTGSLTEANFPGYAQQNLPRGSVISAQTDTTATLSFGSITFSCSGGAPQTIYGAQATTPPHIFGGNQTFVAWNLPDGPQVVSQPGDSIICQLTLTDQRAPGQP